MISQEQYHAAVEKSITMLRQAGLVVTPVERDCVEVADFGLGELEKTGLQIITYVNTERVCAKELIMFPHQTCPEHWHPNVAGKIRQGGNVPVPLGYRVPLRSGYRHSRAFLSPTEGLGGALHR